MGFLSKIRNRVKKQIRPNNMMIGNIRKMPRRPGMMRDMGPGNMPRRPDISDIFGRGSFPFGRRPRGNMGSDFRMPQIGGILREGKKRRGGFGFGLGEAIRRLKKQRDMGMPRRPSTPGMGFLGGTPGFYDRMIGTPQPIPERMPINRFKDPIKRPERMSSVDDGKMYAGGSPGLYKPGGRFYNPEARLQMPQPIPRAEIDISALERFADGRYADDSRSSRGCTCWNDGGQNFTTRLSS